MKRQHIKKGQYYTYCCHLDVLKAEKGWYAQVDEDSIPLEIWDTKIEMILSLSLGWIKSYKEVGMKRVIVSVLECAGLLFKDLRDQ
jgi:hypothetical protein